MRLKPNSILAAPLVVYLVCALTPGKAFATASFSVSGASVTPGVGNQIISKFFPQLGSQQGAGAQLETLMNQAIASELPNFENQVNSNLTPLKDTSEFLSAMASSGSAAGKVMPVDYASDPTIVSLSVSAGVAENGFSLNDFKNFTLDPTKPLPGKGGGATVSGLLGLNLRAFNPPRWSYFDFARLSLFVNFFSIDLNKPQGSSFDVNFETFGVHGMYQLFDSRALVHSGILRWGGLAVSTGFDYSSLTVLYDTSISPSTTTTKTGTIQGTNETLPLSLTYSGAVNLGADIHVFSIPIEVMTHVQLLYLLSIYVGGAFDLNFGSASLAGNASAPMEIDALNPQNSSDTSDKVVVANPTGTLNLGGNSSVSVSDFRGYVGLQINLLAVAIFAQVSGDTSNTLAANAGLRAFW